MSSLRGDEAAGEVRVLLLEQDGRVEPGTLGFDDPARPGDRGRFCLVCRLFSFFSPGGFRIHVRQVVRGEGVGCPCTLKFQGFNSKELFDKVGIAM